MEGFWFDKVGEKLIVGQWCLGRKLGVKIGHEQVMKTMFWLLWYSILME